jgi:hypothetical protein
MRTGSTRINDPTSGAFVVIGQRVHEADLFGHLINRPRWRHVCLPAEYEPDHTRAGEELWAAGILREDVRVSELAVQVWCSS